MVTLTTPARGELAERFDARRLRGGVRRARAAFYQFWRSLAWGRQTRHENSRRKRARRDSAYVFALEVAPRGMVHIHALVYGEFIPQRALESAWSKAIGQRALVDVRTVRPDGGIEAALREVLKYATKGEKGQRVQAAHAAAVELAFRNVHRVTLGGSVRRIKIADCAAATEDMRPEDALEEPVTGCEVCGAVGEWKWVRVVPSEMVAGFGGFGAIRSTCAMLGAGGG